MNLSFQEFRTEIETGKKIVSATGTFFEEKAADCCQRKVHGKCCRIFRKD